MIAQRPPGAARRSGDAEPLPSRRRELRRRDGDHHAAPLERLARGCAELRRVARDSVVVFSWDPAVSRASNVAPEYFDRSTCRTSRLPVAGRPGGRPGRSRWSRAGPVGLPRRLLQRHWRRPGLPRPARQGRHLDWPSAAKTSIRAARPPASRSRQRCLSAPPRRPARARRARPRLPPAHPGPPLSTTLGAWTLHEDPRRARRRARADGRLASPTAATASRGRDGYVVFVARRRPRRPRPRARSASASSAYAEARTVERARARRPSASPAVADHPGAPWQVLPYERQLEVKAEQVARRAARGSASLEDFELEPIVPGRRAVALPQQARVLVRRPTTTARSSAASTRAGSWERIDADRRLPARLRARQRGRAHAALALVPRRTACAPTTAARRPACCATSSSARAGAPAQLQVRLVTSRRGWPHRPTRSPRRSAPAASSGRGRRRRRDHRRRTPRSLHGTRGHRRGAAAACALPRSAPTPSSRPTPRWPSASTRSRPSTPALTGCERVYDLFCGIGTIGLTLAPRAGEVWGLEIVEEAIADAIANARAQRDRQRALLRRRRAPGAARAGRAGRRGPTSSSSTRRAPACRRRSCGGSSRRAPKRIVYVSCNPTTLAPNAAQLVEAGYALRTRAPGRHVPADAAHRVRVALLERAFDLAPDRHAILAIRPV